jgi:hypothetical protein
LLRNIRFTGVTQEKAAERDVKRCFDNRRGIFFTGRRSSSSRFLHLEQLPKILSGKTRRHVLARGVARSGSIKIQPLRSRLARQHVALTSLSGNSFWQML